MQTELSPVVNLADPTAGPLQLLTDGGLDVNLRVTARDFEWAWKTLNEIMDQDDGNRRASWESDGHAEHELRLLCGVFAAVTRMLPMTPSNYIDWLEVFEGGSGAMESYVITRACHLSDDSLSFILKERDLDALGLERIDEPVRDTRAAMRRSSKRNG